jgi:diketogulonate reductase-like aldo/keto reductase
MPLVGLGTFQMKGDTCKHAVEFAIKHAGYTRIDTAACYANECEVAAGIEAAGVDRKDIFITSKLSNYDMKKGEDHAYKACITSLTNLKTNYIDLWLVHWPGAKGIALHSDKHAQFRKDVWKSCEKLFLEGKVRRIGVSNYTVKHLQEMQQYASIQPCLNQIELHPYIYPYIHEHYPTLQHNSNTNTFHNDDANSSSSSCCSTSTSAAVSSSGSQSTTLFKYCTDNHIILEAYSSLGQGDSTLLKNPIVIKLAETNKCMPSEILLR